MIFDVVFTLDMIEHSIWLCHRIGFVYSRPVRGECHILCVSQMCLDLEIALERLQMNSTKA